MYETLREQNCFNFASFIFHQSQCWCYGWISLTQHWPDLLSAQTHSNNHQESKHVENFGEFTCSFSNLFNVQENLQIFQALLLQILPFEYVQVNAADIIPGVGYFGLQSSVCVGTTLLNFPRRNSMVSWLILVNMVLINVVGAKVAVPTWVRLRAVDSMI